MATTTVRLTDQEEALLDGLAQRYGGRSGAIRAAIGRLAEEQNRQDALASALQAWAAERGEPVKDDAVADAIKRFGLGR
ncbi:MAG: ribbon-helix-helix domain-containing protein [Euzebya sp.]